MLLLVPRSPLAPRRADEHFAPEAAAARELGVPVAFVDHDQCSRDGGDADAAVRAVPGDPDAVHRGWMLRSEQYAAMAGALARRGTLRTSPAQFRTAHELPGWYAALAAVTPESRWTTGAVDWRWLNGAPAGLRDSTESLEHSWAEAVCVPDSADPAAAQRVADRLLELRGSDLVRRADGVWRGTALGDGQVSDRPASTPPAELIGALLAGPAGMGT